MQSEIFRQTWQFPNFIDSAFNGFDDNQSQLHYFPTKFPDDPLLMDFPIEDFLMDFDGYGPIDPITSPPLNGGEESVHGQWSPLSSSSLKSDESSVTEASQASGTLSLPAEDMEIDTQLSLQHLAKAFGEAMENGQADLMEAVSRCGVEKANPLGGACDRLVFNLFRRAGRREGCDDYIRQECQRNSEAAFQAFYQGFPFMRFAHFAANSAILGSAPRGFGVVIRVVDFDLGEGVQWAPVIEAMAARGGVSLLRLTSIKWAEDDPEEAKEDDSHDCPGRSGRRLRDTSRRLSEHAREFGVQLEVDEMRIDELLIEAKEGMAMNGRREWFVFNCMVGLMGRKNRNRKLVGKFLSAAEEVITANNCGIVTLGEGDAFQKLKSCSGFGEFFDGCLGHYQTVLECMETEFPSQLLEARLAMEALFVSPSIDPTSWGETWDEVRACSGVMDGIQARLRGLRVSREGLMEARELVGGKSWYGVGTGERENEMVLQWRGNPLVRFSAWGR
ncbi:protein NODULATION SIGNALING PATHWAY 2-like [Punica granatum]|uniref:Uncharacterized protein n=2 Tax=Punica granatum TaxID=22663 RepID=A0A218W4D1_PUNGR|nr:protein NODULATION SIGNALING PATHWAY 2-like [Punica granatum]OWM67101.1 hypothetical protein CDL15_Pgr000553 [Punica granatum]PKI51447.1 hypothetical protein CRG98_028158 [Punica granatum]